MPAPIPTNNSYFLHIGIQNQYNVQYILPLATDNITIPKIGLHYATQRDHIVESNK